MNSKIVTSLNSNITNSLSRNVSLYNYCLIKNKTETRSILAVYAVLNNLRHKL